MLLKSRRVMIAFSAIMHSSVAHVGRLLPMGWTEIYGDAHLAYQKSCPSTVEAKTHERKES